VSHRAWPSVVYLVLLHLKRTHSLGNFFRFLDNKPDAAALLQVYARENDVELLRDFYYQDDRRTESACLALRESLGVSDFGDKMAKIRSGLKSFNEDKERGFEAKVRLFRFLDDRRGLVGEADDIVFIESIFGQMVDDQLRLLAYQQTLERECDGRKSFLGLNINETIRQCLVSGWPKKADKVKSDWKVPDKRYGCFFPPFPP
jgi:vacuolar protein sorting-associated protein 16